MKLKLIIVSLFSLCTVQTAIAGSSEFKTSIQGISDKYPGAKAIVMFKSTDTRTASAKIAGAMQVEHPVDPFGNKFWVTKIFNTYIDKTTGCGVVVGQWRSNVFHSMGLFENAVFNKVNNMTVVLSFVYLQADGKGIEVTNSIADSSDTWYNACFD